MLPGARWATCCWAERQAFWSARSSLKHLISAGSANLLNAILGAILVTTASWQIFFSFRQCGRNSDTRDRSPLLSWLMFPVGAEVGFSSAGAGALGSAALLSMTPLAPAQVVGTDIVFGFVVSLIGSGAHWFTHATNPELLLQLIIGGVAGAVCGTLLSTRVPRRPLRFALWVWLLILGGQFLFNSYHVWAATRWSKPAAENSLSAHGPTGSSGVNKQ